MAKMVPHSQSTENIKEVSSQLNAVMVTPVGISRAMVKIDKKITPILENLFKSPDGHHGKLAFKQLFDWLMHPKRIVEEFIYVLGPLVHDFKKWTKHKDTIYIGMIYVGMAALEAIAVKCPVLDGNWEISVWLIMQIMYYCDFFGDCDIVSNQLSTWIIHIIGDADSCPNAHLRIELIKLLIMVKIGAHNRTQAFNAVMDACSNLSNDYLARNDKGCFKCSLGCHTDYISDCNYNGCSKICFGTIVNIFNHIIVDDLWADFSKRLFHKLSDVNSARLSSIVHDFTYACGVNPNKYTEPRELHSLIALLNTTGGFFQEEFHKVKLYRKDYWFCENRKDIAMDMFEILMKKFKICYQIPQLIYPTASFVIDVMEFILTNNFYHGPTEGTYDHPTEGTYDWSVDIKDLDATFIIYFDYILQELLIGSSSNTVDILPIGRELISQYGSRLKKLKEFCGDFDTLPTIHNLLKHV